MLVYAYSEQDNSTTIWLQRDKVTFSVISLGWPAIMVPWICTEIVSNHFRVKAELLFWSWLWRLYCCWLALLMNDKSLDESIDKQRKVRYLSNEVCLVFKTYFKDFRTWLFLCSSLIASSFLAGSTQRESHRIYLSLTFYLKIFFLSIYFFPPLPLKQQLCQTRGEARTHCFAAFAVRWLVAASKLLYCWKSSIKDKKRVATFVQQTWML